MNKVEILQRARCLISSGATAYICSTLYTLGSRLKRQGIDVCQDVDELVDYVQEAIGYHISMKYFLRSKRKWWELRPVTDKEVLKARLKLLDEMIEYYKEKAE